MTASSPCSPCCTGFLLDDPESRDQNPQLEPALGAGAGGSGVGSATGGASCISTSSGSCICGGGASGSAAGTVASSCEGIGALLPAHDHTQDPRDEAASLVCARVLFGISTGAEASWASGTSLSASDGLSSSGGVSIVAGATSCCSGGCVAGAGAGAGEGVTTAGDLPSHPNHPAGGRWCVAEAGGWSAAGDSTG